MSEQGLPGSSNMTTSQTSSNPLVLERLQRAKDHNSSKKEFMREPAPTHSPIDEAAPQLPADQFVGNQQQPSQQPIAHELFNAVRDEDAEKVHKLLKCMVDAIEEKIELLDAKYNEGETLLHIACRSSEPNMSQVVDTLIAHGADVEATSTKELFTPLMLAAEVGAEKTVRLLLAAGADPTTEDCSGRTAIMHASEHSEQENLRRLLNDWNPQVEAILAGEKAKLLLAMEKSKAMMKPLDADNAQQRQDKAVFQLIKQLDMQLQAARKLGLDRDRPEFVHSVMQAKNALATTAAGRMWRALVVRLKAAKSAAKLAAFKAVVVEVEELKQKADAEQQRMVKAQQEAGELLRSVEEQVREALKEAERVLGRERDVRESINSMRAAVESADVSRSADVLSFTQEARVLVQSADERVVRLEPYVEKAKAAMSESKQMEPVDRKAHIEANEVQEAIERVSSKARQALEELSLLGALELGKAKAGQTTIKCWDECKLAATQACASALEATKLWERVVQIGKAVMLAVKEAEKATQAVKEEVEAARTAIYNAASHATVAKDFARNALKSCLETRTLRSLRKDGRQLEDALDIARSLGLCQDELEPAEFLLKAAHEIGLRLIWVLEMPDMKLDMNVCVRFLLKEELTSLKAAAECDVGLLCKELGQDEGERLHKRLAVCMDLWDEMTGPACDVTSDFEQWRKSLNALDKSRSALEKAQDAVRARVAPPPEQEEEDEEAAAEAQAARDMVLHHLDDAVHERDRTRDAHIQLIDKELMPERIAKAKEQLERLMVKRWLLEQEGEDAIKLDRPRTVRMQLERLTGDDYGTGAADEKRREQALMPPLHKWLAQVSSLKNERDGLKEHATSAPETTELQKLYKTWETLKRTLRDSLNTVDDLKGRTEKKEAQAAAVIARTNLQRAERLLHKERVRVASLASTHFPELAAREKLLDLGTSIDSEALRRLCVQRQFSHYSGPNGKGEPIEVNNTRNGLLAAHYDGNNCMLKRYGLNKVKQWDKVENEVQMLVELKHRHIIELHAVFKEEKTLAAYLQMPLCNGGDMQTWLKENKPELPLCKILLSQLAEALQHVHAHGKAHGDIKLENVLVHVNGKHVTAHLADFEFACDQQAAESSISSTVSTVSMGTGFTRMYVAPERLEAMMFGNPPVVPTSAADMFAYGVCALVACCFPTDPDERKLISQQFEKYEGTDWLQLKERACNLALPVDKHLAALLDSLLMPAKNSEEALRLRMSATQVLLHPFLDAAALHAHAMDAIERAEDREQEVELRRQELESKQAIAQRELEWNTALARKQLAEEEKRVKDLTRELEREACAQADRMHRNQQKLERQEEKAKQAKRLLEAAKLKIESSRAAAEIEEAKQRDEADRLRQQIAEEEAKVRSENERMKRKLRQQQDKVANETKKLERLKEECAKQPFLGVQYHKVWQRGPDREMDGLLRVRNGCTEFDMVAKDLMENMEGPANRPFGVNVLAVWRVQNDMLWRRYFHEREETKRCRKDGANETRLWMSSGPTDPAKLCECEKGFDPTYYERKSYGSGAYFAKWALYSHAWRPCNESKLSREKNVNYIIRAQVALGCVKDYGAKFANDLVREPVMEGGGQCDSWSGTEDDMRWSKGSVHKDALKAHGQEYGRQYIVCRYQKAYPQYILQYKMK